MCDYIMMKHTAQMLDPRKWIPQRGEIYFSPKTLHGASSNPGSRPETIGPRGEIRDDTWQRWRQLPSRMIARTPWCRPGKINSESYWRELGCGGWRTWWPHTTTKASGPLILISVATGEGQWIRVRLLTWASGGDGPTKVMSRYK